jgi:hypothetical protein
MRLLFLHQNFPGQFRHLAAHFAADSGNRVLAIGEASNLESNTIAHPRVELHPYPTPKPVNAATHRYVQPYEAAVHRGLAVTTICQQLKAEGFVPDLIMAHPGWGDALFVRDTFPDSPLVDRLRQPSNAFVRQAENLVDHRRRRLHRQQLARSPAQTRPARRRAGQLQHRPPAQPGRSPDPDHP